MKPSIKIKRAYADVSNDDGYRVLIDRLWPRGVTRKDLQINQWAKDIAPTSTLRKWFGHKPERWKEFQKDYLKELKVNKAADEFVKSNKAHAVITLIYAAKDEKHTHALVLQNFLEHKF
ncbi:DUF488 domain-containing protein [Niabella ginsengisoli]|uniref:DUF488 family protein n=1 Tax=Niabella ginsengisoli TaxID=522298 RepID=A0ABS9SKJ4_9BACT|nr:DUF488 family protein [Niabella ginsengisoli]MCH5598875.1 DUF488 family protein [Niabella ginsengisoli]